MKRHNPRHFWKAGLIGGVLVALAVFTGYFSGAFAEDAADAARAADSQSGQAASTADNASGNGAAAQNGPFSAAGLQARQAQLALWRSRYERAEQVYANYRDATRYPHDSQLLTAKTDQNHPFNPIAEEKTLRNAKGEAINGVRLRTTQERVFVTGAETVKFTIEAVNDKGENLPLTVARAAAQSIPEARSATLIQATVDFSDNGGGVDELASDGKYTALLNPAAQGFENFAGTIRLLATVSAGTDQGVAHFDVVYTPQAPATWAGVREGIETGSLSIYLKANIARAGRYVASARVDDAQGNPLALLQFNQEVGTGAQEFRLRLFGALIRDKNPAFPLRVRDVEGFLLIPDQFPDRAMLARQPGIVHSTGRYTPDQFSPNEWSSEERDRYLAEYGKDAENALAQINRLNAK